MAETAKNTSSVYAKQSNSYSDIRVARCSFQLPLKPYCRICALMPRDSSRRTMRIVLAPRIRNTCAIGPWIYEEKCTRVPDACRGGSPPGGRTLHGQGRKRQSQDFAGAFWPAIYGNLTRPCTAPRGNSTSTAFRRVSNGLPWWSPFIKCPLSELLGELSFLTILQPLAVFPPRFPDPILAPLPRQTSFLWIPS